MGGRVTDKARLALCDLLLPAALGAIAVLGFAPFGYYGLTWLALAGLIGLWWRATARRCAWRGFLFGLGLFGTGLHWPFVSVYHYGNAPLPLAVVLVCLLVVYLSLYPALIGLLCGAMRRLPDTLRALLFMPAAWLLCELLRDAGIIGFPWLSLGYTLTDAPVTGLAPLGGVYFLSFLLVMAAGTLVLLVAGSLVGRAVSVALIAVTPIVLWAVPAPTTWTQPVGEPLQVAIIQGNFPQDVKWDKAYFQPTLARYKRLTKQVDADVVVWPEVAIPTLIRYAQDYLRTIDTMAQAKGQTVLVGTLAQRQGTDMYYNAVLALGQGEGTYFKRHLVPFGEYFPLPEFAKRWMDAIDMRYSSFARGAIDQPLITAAGTKFGLSICFEDVFGDEVARTAPQAGVLVNVTNDAWFAGTVAAAQHLNISRMRALETGRVLLRAANTGISAVIGPAGRIIKRADQFEVAVIEATIQPRTGTTPYVRYGNAPLWAGAFVLVVVGLFGSEWLRRRKAAAVPEGGE